MKETLELSCVKSVNSGRYRYLNVNTLIYEKKKVFGDSRGRGWSFHYQVEKWNYVNRGYVELLAFSNLENKGTPFRSFNQNKETEPGRSA